MGTPPFRPTERDVSPGLPPDVTPPRAQPATHDFTLQAVIEMQRSIGDLAAKVDRLIVDVGKQGDKVDILRETGSFVKGAVWVMGILGVIVVPFITWLLNHSYPPSTTPQQQPLLATTPARGPPIGNISGSVVPR